MIKVPPHLVANLEKYSLSLEDLKQFLAWSKTDNYGEEIEDIFQGIIKLSATLSDTDLSEKDGIINEDIIKTLTKGLAYLIIEGERRSNAKYLKDSLKH